MTDQATATQQIGLKRVKMRLFTVLIMIFTLTCSGAFGMEDVLGGYAGLGLIMILVLPIFWALPMALISAELGSALPEEGGFYRWVRRALGEFWGFQAGWWWQLSLFVDTAVYIALTVDYFQSTWGLSGWERWLIGFGLIVVFTFINIRGLDLTGLALTIVQIVVFVPFIIFMVLGFAKAQTNPFEAILPTDVSVWTAVGWGLAVGMWMYSGYESMSMVAGEIENPQKLIPRALLINMGLVIGFYFLTTLAMAVAAPEGSYFSTYGEEGSVDFISIGKAIGGEFVRYGLLAAMIAGNLGLFMGYLASGSRPIYVFSKDKLFAKWASMEHKKYRTPWIAIIFMAALDSLLIIGSFSFLIVIDVFCLMLAYIVIMISAVVLRKKDPDLKRSYRIPLNTWGLALFITPAILIAIYALISNGWSYFAAGCLAVLSGPLMYLIFKSSYHGVRLQSTDRVQKDLGITGPAIPEAVATATTIPEEV
jgi:amino acid transporter